MEEKKVKILFKEEDINRRIKELGEKITNDYRDKKPLLISILKGGGFFVADLARSIKLDLTIDYISASSYGKETESSGNVRILKDISQPIVNKDIILVEDIIDTGYTLKSIYDMLKTRNPRSIKICVLLDKPSRRKVKVLIHYKGFEIPDLFVVGFGIDFAERYRNLPYIGYLE
jgi:hypoxanthine phosphoribosyltransferase